MCIVHLKFVVARNSMIGNPLEKLKFQCVTEVNLGLKKKSLNSCIVQMWLIWSLRWREEVRRNRPCTSQWTSDASRQGRSISPKERSTYSGRGEGQQFLV